MIYGRDRRRRVPAAPDRLSMAETFAFTVMALLLLSPMLVIGGNAAAEDGKDGTGAVTISDLFIAPTSGLEGDQVNITARITNSGDQDACGLSVVFYDGFGGIGAVNGISVPARSTSEVMLCWTLPQVLSDEEHTITATLNGTGRAAGILVCDRTPIIELAPVGLPYDIKVDGPIAFPVTVRNTGTGDAGGLSVQFLDGTDVLSCSDFFALPPGEEKVLQVECTAIGPSECRHEYRLRVGTVEVRAERFVSGNERPARISITDIYYEPVALRSARADGSQLTELTVVLQNAGDSEGTVHLTALEGRGIIGYLNVTVEGNQTLCLHFTWSMKGTGIHRAVAYLTGEDAVVQEPVVTEYVMNPPQKAAPRAVLDGRVVLSMAGLGIAVALFAAGTWTDRRRKLAALAGVGSGQAGPGSGQDGPGPNHARPAGFPARFHAAMPRMPGIIDGARVKKARIAKLPPEVPAVRLGSWASGELVTRNAR
jgi:hypothetical protein